MESVQGYANCYSKTERNSFKISASDCMNGGCFDPSSILCILSYTNSNTVAYAGEMTCWSHQHGVICGLSGGMWF